MSTRAAPSPLIDVVAIGQRSWALFASKPIQYLIASLISFLLFSFSGGLLTGPVFVGQIRMIDRHARAEELRLNDIFSGFSYFWTALFTGVALFVSFVFGVMFLVLPGLLVIAGWGFAFHFIALRGTGVMGALAGSWRLFCAHWRSVLLLLFLVGGAHWAMSAAATMLGAMFSGTQLFGGAVYGGPGTGTPLITIPAFAVSIFGARLGGFFLLWPLANIFCVLSLREMLAQQADTQGVLSPSPAV